ncbi:MAG: hypothetical protein F6K24_46065, partial [Okeania sp. SIO2D1]|nr:hypothetical protein [Okeania sp. SIO2D1]
MSAVLTSKKVKHCLVRHKVAGEEKISRAVFYEGKTFVKGETYASDEGREALQHSRDFFLANKGEKECLVLECKKGFTLWYQDDFAQIVKKSKTKDLVSQIDLKKLVTKMRDIDGIPIQDRRHKLTVYPRCFVGSEAVKWFRKKLKLSKKQAVKLGQRLIDENWIHHVLDEHNFR